GEEQQPVMRTDRHQMFDEILFAGGRADFAAAAAALRAIERERGALDIAAVRDSDQHVFLDDQVFDREITFGLDNLGAALVGELLADIGELGDDQLIQFFRVGQNLPQPRDRLFGLLVLGLDLFAFERSQPAQREVEDRLGLRLTQLELRHQAGARGLAVLGTANQLDHRVEVAQRDQQSLEDMQPRLGLTQLELGTPGQHLAAMAKKLHQHIAQAQFTRAPLVDRQHDHPVTFLHLAQLVELVKDNPRLGVAFELDHDPHAVAIGFVAQVADPLEPLVVDQLGDPLDQLPLVDLVGNLANDDRRLSGALVGFDRGQRAHRENAAFVQISPADRGAAEQLAAGRKIGAGDNIEDLFE